MAMDLEQRAAVWAKRQRRRIRLCTIGLAIVVACAGVVLVPQATGVRAHGLGASIVYHLIHPRFFEEFACPLCMAYATPTGEVQLTGCGVVNSHQDLKDTAPDDSTFVVIAYCTQHQYLTGSWAATGVYRDAMFQLNSDEAIGSPTPDQQQEIRRIAVEAMARGGQLLNRESAADLIRLGSWSGAKTLWVGYVINVLTIVGLFMGLWFGTRAAWDLRRTSRAKRGACLACGYELRGLAAGTSACPECGSAVGIRDAGENSPAQQ